MRVCTDIFIMGVILGVGPCLYFCAPIISPLIAATQSGWLKGLKSVILFSLSRIFAYVVLASVATVFGQLTIDRFYGDKLTKNIHFTIGLFILLIGVILLLGKSPRLKICQRLCRHTTSQSLKSLVILGLLIGFSPCLPMLGVLGYIASESKDLLYGAFLGLCFGLGTAISPLIPLGILSAGLPRLILRRERFLDIFNRICGLFLIYLGLQLIIRVLGA